jgi:hypothetical protein
LTRLAPAFDCDNQFASRDRLRLVCAVRQAPESRQRGWTDRDERSASTVANHIVGVVHLVHECLHPRIDTRITLRSAFEALVIRAFLRLLALLVVALAWEALTGKTLAGLSLPKWRLERRLAVRHHRRCAGDSHDENRRDQHFRYPEHF